MNNVAMARAVRMAAKPKFRGGKALKSKRAARYPKHIEREYRAMVDAYMDSLGKMLPNIIAQVEKMAGDGDGAGFRQDAATRDYMPPRPDQPATIDQIAAMFRHASETIDKRATAFGLGRKINGIAALTGKLSISDWKRTVHQTIGLDILGDYYKGEYYQRALAGWAQSNVGLIKTIPKGSLARMETIVREGYLRGGSSKAIAAEIRAVYSADSKYARFVARDQIAKLNADLAASQQKDAGVTEYEWSTSGDGRVRDSHQALDGTRQRWDDPPIVDDRTGRRAHPGQDYQCRCVALPIFDIDALDLPWGGKNNATAAIQANSRVA